MKKQIQQATTEQTHAKKINERLRSLSPAEGSPKQGLIWSRKNLKTNLSCNYKFQQPVNQIKERKLNIKTNKEQ